jgi:hypothetical protein
MATRAATPPPPPATVDAPPLVFADPALIDAVPPTEPEPEPDSQVDTQVDTQVDDLVATPATPGPGATRLGLPRFREYRAATGPPSVDADPEGS